MLCLLVSIRFQVLFHSPPGVLFTFPSRYYSLSVTWSYLAFGDGPPSFHQDSSCPGVLWILLASSRFRVRGCHPLWPTFLDMFLYRPLLHLAVLTILYISIKDFGLLPISLATTLGIVYLLSFPLGIEMFQFPRFPLYNYWFIIQYHNITRGEFPHSDIYGSKSICDSP